MNYIIMLAAGLLGILLYSFRKIKGIRKRQPGVPFKKAWNTYWQEEVDTVAISLLMVIAAVFISNEFLRIDSDTGTPGGITSMLQYNVAMFIRTTFIGIGYCANSILDAFLGTTEVKLEQKAKDGGVQP